MADELSAPTTTLVLNSELIVVASSAEPDSPVHGQSVVGSRVTADVGAASDGEALKWPQEVFDSAKRALDLGRPESLESRAYAYQLGLGSISVRVEHVPLRGADGQPNALLHHFTPVSFTSTNPRPSAPMGSIVPAGEDARKLIADVLDGIADALVAVDADGKIAYLNASAERVWDAHRVDLIGNPVTHGLPAEVAEIFRLEVASAIRTGTQASFEVFHRPLDAWLATHICPARDGILLHIEDVTAQKRDEESAWLLRDIVAAMENAPSPDDAIAGIPATVIAAQGWEGAEVWFPADDSTAVAPDTSASLEAGEVEMWANRAVTSGKVVHNAPDHGTTPTNTIVAVPLFARSTMVAVLVCRGRKTPSLAREQIEVLSRGMAQAGGIVQNGRALATLAHMSQQLMERERLLAIAGKIAHLGGWSVDVATGEAILSDEVCEIHDMAPGHQLSLSQAVSFYTPDSQEQIRTSFERCVEAGTPYDIHVEGVSQLGRRLRLRVMGEAVVGEDGLTQRVHGAVMDVTEAWEQEQSLRRAERLASIGTLVAGVAHELSNPLHAIRNLAELLLMEDRSDEEREELNLIVREADRASKVVEDLRLSARRSQEIQADREAVNLNDVIRHIVKMRSYVASTRNIAIVTDLAEALPPLLGERSALEQVLLNLIVNAEHAVQDIEREPRRIIVRTRRTSEGLALHVVDNGAGIPPQNLQRLFDPFFTTKDPGEGTGLGLSLVYRIVADHGGEVRVESEVGKGTAFRVDLPLLRQAVGSAQVKPPPAAAVPLHVLVVDDEPSIRRVTERFLTLRGHRVDAAAEGEEALSKILSTAYDVIVTDLRMPGLSGYELLDRVDELAAGLEKRLVFLTGDPGGEGTEERKRLRDIPVLLKPVVMDDLLRVIEEAARRAGPPVH